MRYMLCLLFLLFCNLCYAWEVRIAPIVGWKYEIANADFDIVKFSEAKPPFVVATFPGYRTRQYSYASIRDVNDFGVSIDCIDQQVIASGFRFKYGVGIDLKKVDIIYDLQLWYTFYGINPFGYREGPHVMNGRADVEVDSFHLTPSLVYGVAYAMTSKVSISIDGALGLAYIMYDDYNFYDPLHQRLRVIPPEQREALSSPSHDWIPQVKVSLGVDYQFSEAWRVFLSQGIVWQANYTLNNLAESNASYHGLTISINNPWHLQTSAGVGYHF